MYENYWGLTEKPFRNTPDPKYLFSSLQHEDSLMKLTYAVTEGMGAAVLTGVFGCGKTLIGRALLRDLGNRYKVAFITNPRVSDVELLRGVVRNLKSVELPSRKGDLSADALLEQLQEITVSNQRDGSGTVVIVDEAHSIENEDIFEQLRMLLNFQQDDRFLLTLLLIGQPELAGKISNLKQLEQRIAIKSHLDRLNGAETVSYIQHRLSVGGRTGPVFREDACEAILRYSDGIPRRINHVCDLSLLTGFGRKAKGIDRDIVDAAIADFGL
ncbi:ExeA family protein [Planctomycetota bacterium]